MPRSRSGVRLELARLVPSGRSLLVAFAILAGGAGAYVVARETSVFAVATISVEGAPPSVALQVERALRGEVGTSLLKIDLTRARTTLDALPTIASTSFDRAFPHTLRVEVVPERPVVVVRQGASSWLVSARGRVMASLPLGARPLLPRIWVGRGPTFAVGAGVAGELRPAVAAVAPLLSTRFPARVAVVRSSRDELTLVLRSGLEIRLGDPTYVALKLAVAAKVLPLLGSGTRYVDVSAPDRPVAGSLFQQPATASPAMPATTAATPAPPSVASPTPSAGAQARPATAPGTPGAPAPVVVGAGVAAAGGGGRAAASSGAGPATPSPGATRTTLKSQVKVYSATSTGP